MELASDCDDNESDSFPGHIEEELYSVLHYNDFSKGVPEEVLIKYNVNIDEEGNMSISLKEDVNNPDIENGNESSKVNTTSELITAGSSISTLDNKNEDCSQKEKECNTIVNKNMHSNNKDLNKKEQLSSNIQKQFIYVSESDDELVDRKGEKRKVQVVTLSDEDSDCDIIINTQEDCVIQISDSEEPCRLSPPKKNWKIMSAPSTWTKKMKRYYNKPLDHLRDFDHHTIMQAVQGNKKRKLNWFLNSFDLHPRPADMRTPVCSVCHMRGHLPKECFHRPIPCYMCGNFGHQETRCPHKMCLNCGTKSQVYLALCGHCASTKSSVCGICHKKGHTNETCTDIWRRYHATTSGDLNKEYKDEKPRRKECCNCGQEGHLFEQCRELYYLPYPITSFLVTNYNGEDSFGSNHRIYLPKNLNIEDNIFKHTIQKFQKKGLKITLSCSQQTTNPFLIVTGGMELTNHFRDSLLGLKQSFKNKKTRKITKEKKKIKKRKNKEKKKLQKKMMMM